MPTKAPSEALSVASTLASATSSDVFKMFEELREEGRLSSTIRELNTLLQDTQHRDVALAALRRLGLEYGG